MKKKIAMLIIGILLISNIYIPVAYAQDQQIRDPRELYNLGEAIAINVKSYEPTVLTSNMLDDVASTPVYAFLEGYTLGSFLGDQRPAIEPLYGDPTIRSISVRVVNSSRFIRGVRYVRPSNRQISLSDLGTLVIDVGRQTKESELPGNEDFSLFGDTGSINVDLMARIEFYTERLVDFGEESLLLKENKNENDWRSLQLDDYSFWGRRGYIRPGKITGDSATFDLYDGSLRPIIRGKTLRVGETSQPFIIGDYGRELLENRYRVRLDGVVEPGVRTAKVKLTIDGETIGYKILKEGQTLYPGSQWIVKSIERGVTNGRTTERLVLRNRNGEEEIVSREYAGQVIATGEDPCKSLIDNDYCKAISELAKVDAYKDISDEDNILYNIKSSYFIAKSYESISDTQVNNPRIVADARQKAIEYYKKVSEYNKANEKKFNNVEVDKKLDELAKKTAGNVLGGESVIVEGNAELYERNIHLSLISIDTGQDVTSQKPLAVLEINGALNTVTLEKGDLLTNVEMTDYKGRYKWLLTDVFDDRIRVTKSYTGAATIVPGQPTVSGVGADMNSKLSKYETTIRNVAQKYNVDPNLIKAMIWQESSKDANGIPEADSHYTEPDGRESFGLMQIICRNRNNPSGSYTAQEVGFTGDCEDLNQPELGIEYGTKYLKKQLDRFGDYQLALAAYNGGPGEIDRNCGVTYSSCSGLDSRVPVYVASVSGYKSEFERAIGIAPSIGAETREIITGRTEILDSSHSVKLVRVDLKKYALFTIVPGTGAPLYSESTFSVHIPIEKRAIELTPKRIDKELNKTKERLEKLDSTIASLEDLVKKWKALCLITFAYLTLKNSFFSGLSRSKAREQVMKEDQVTVDGQNYNGWNAYCASSETKKYGGFDHCINENSARITEDINNAEGNIEKVNQELSSIKDISKTTDQAAFASKNGMTQEQVGTLVKYNKMSAEDARRLTYLKAAGKTEEYNKQLTQLKTDADRYISYETVANSKIGQYNGLLDPDKRKWEQLISTLDQGVTPGSIEKTELIPFLQEKYSDVDIKNGKQVNTAWIDTAGRYYTFDEAGNDVVLEPVKRGELNVEYEGKQLFVGVVEGSTQRQLFFVESTGELRTTFAVKPAIEYNEDYTPYIIPLNPRTCGNGNANYVEVRNQNGRPVEYKVYNVGKNGLVEPNGKNTDDSQVYSDDQLRNRPENLKLLQCAERAYNAASGKYKQGERVRISGTEEYAASFQAATLKQRLSQPKCSDVMDPRDCKILYNICDPVMCPVSRFNLGGRWQLPAGTSVAQTGIIGSIILGLPNWQFYPGNKGKGDNIIPPVCMTGVLAGLKGLRGVLQGYEQCLVAAKVNGESIGICDRIRSIYACEILWKEALAIFKVHGSLVGLLSNALGETAGGGEYLTLESSVTNAANSVEFFTREYATSAFAAYQARSTDEIGSQICKAAIYGEFPGIGNVMDELSRPEDPPQFTAILSTMPYSSTLHQSRYNIFYYIYAGNDIIGVTRGPLKYSVFLYNPSTNKRFYATERCDRPTGIIKRGESATFSVDCPADDGFTQVCVDLAGRLQCGFGKVSSDFALNYVNDLVVANEVKKQINSEEQCRPDDPRYGSSFAGLIAGNPGVLNSGVQRFCSVQNPGAGTNSFGDWMRIGDCGKDKEGRALGSCWMDTKSYSIKDTTLAKSVNDDLQQRGFDTATAEDTKRLLDAAYNSYKEKKITVSDDGRIKENEKPVEDASFNGLLDEFINLLTHFDDKVRANAQFMIGMIFYDKASRRTIEVQKQQATEESEGFYGGGEFGGSGAGDTSPLFIEKKVDNKEVLEQFANLPDLPENCKLISAYWGRTIVNNKDYVDLIVTGQSCEGLVFEVNIYEEDYLADDPVLDTKFTMRNNEGKLSWQADWESDELGDPEYKFDVKYSKIGYPDLELKSNNILTVREQISVNLQ